MGMTADEYWRGAPELARHYRQAELIRLEQQNQLLWLQGLYIYDALCAASPVFRSFTKRGTKPIPYIESPYPMTKRERKSDAAREEKKVFDKGKAYFAAILAQQSKKKNEERGPQQ